MKVGAPSSIGDSCLIGNGNFPTLPLPPRFSSQHSILRKNPPLLLVLSIYCEQGLMDPLLFLFIWCSNCPRFVQGVSFQDGFWLVSTYPIFVLKHLLIFWHNKMFQAHLKPSLMEAGISSNYAVSFKRKMVFMNLGLDMWYVHCLWAFITSRTFQS